MIALPGANGTGKSQTLKAISGLVPARFSQVSCVPIRFQGQDNRFYVHELARKRIVHGLKGQHLFARLPVEEKLRSSCFLRNPTRRELKQGLQRICLCPV
ncbi:ATP-binding cassette domain-containing protein [Pseudomonas sp. NyZ201]|uniref:ATP-binding cassette domain-containing protein n=1 Tax=Pseudomonas sp. NyZ201 TaxID=3409857 RepID=UPI003CF42DC9